MIDNTVNKNDIALKITEPMVRSLINNLGKKQKLTYETKHGFCIDKSTIINIHKKLEEKIERDTAAHISNITINIKYLGGVCEEFSGIDKLEEYRKEGSEFPIEICAEWNILLHFNNSETIENQKIILLFEANSYKLMVRFPRKTFPKIKLLIEHTNESWAKEILNIFNDCINNILYNSETKFFFRKDDRIILAYNLGKWLSFIFTIMFVVFTYFVLSSNYTAINKNMDLMKNKIYNMSLKGEIDINELYITLDILNKKNYTNRYKQFDIKNKIKRVIKIGADRRGRISMEFVKKYYFITIGLLIFSSLQLMLHKNYTVSERYVTYGFINMTPRSYRIYKFYKSNQKKGAIISITMIITAIVCSVIGGLILNVMI